jgi:hypothetical protein
MADIRKGIKNLLAMNDAEFSAAIGGKTLNRVREAARMSPPRTPRGEKPQTTIRLLRKTVRDLTQTIGELRDQISLANHANFTNEAGSRVKISELETQFLIEQARADRAETDVRRIDAALHIIRVRSAYLEGYYAKSAEILTDDQTQALARAGARTAGGVPHGKALEEGGGPRAFEGRPD